MAERAALTYVVDDEELGRPLTTAELVAACNAILAVVRPRLRWAVIDAFTDNPEDELDSDARAAQQDLFSRQAKGIGIRLDVTSADDWQVLCAFAAHSINVELLAEDQNQFGALHDSGASLVVELSDQEAKDLQSRISGIAPLVLIDVVDERRRLAVQAARAERHRRMRAYVRHWLGRSPS